MIVKQIEDNLILYQIPSKGIDQLGHNIYVMIDGSRALTIDTGYESHYKLIVKDLESKGIKVVKAVASHFHPEQVDGLFLLNKPKIYGNKEAVTTLRAYYDVDELKEITPNKLIGENSVVEFGDFKMKFNYAPGHSDCSMIITINDRYLHVGDLYMTTDAGEPVLPYVKWKDVKRHIASLKLITAKSYEGILLARGVSPIGGETVAIGVEDRLIYLRNLLKSSNKATVEEAMAGCTQPFKMTKWRDAVN